MLFEWDEAKRDANFRGHGVDLVDAARVFANPVLERLDDRDDHGEDRWIAIGRWRVTYLVVVYTWRDDCRRIISAWKAGRYEREENHASLFG